MRSAVPFGKFSEALVVLADFATSLRTCDFNVVTRWEFMWVSSLEAGSVTIGRFLSRVRFPERLFAKSSLFLTDNKDSQLLRTVIHQLSALTFLPAMNDTL
jgi:hypothetical protein